MKKQYSVGAFEAKTHLSRLLEEAEQGYSITITKRGKAVARLIPFQQQKEDLERREIIKEFAVIRDSVQEKVKIAE
ncbi:MAG: type II toxin-antitoxin system prevent-host-death family antitoxin, partial [Bacteroidetes bacterium]|nr:type II toxin-antitoxin system prevent-host-death family antitoxin [Bacteroidota bacterium]